MRGKRDLYKVGDEYGRLKVRRIWTEKRANKKSKETVCECECSCGKFVVVCGRYLRAGHKQSCGCLQRLNNKNHHAWKGHGEIGRSTWNDIVRGCKRRGKTIPLSLTIEQAWDLFLTQNRKCALSGVEIGFSTRAKRRDVKNNTASLDRIDSEGGYTLGNVQWVHKIIQNMKWTLPQDDFIKWCRFVATKG